MLKKKNYVFFKKGGYDGFFSQKVRNGQSRYHETGIHDAGLQKPTKLNNGFSNAYVLANYVSLLNQIKP